MVSGQQVLLAHDALVDLLLKQRYGKFKCLNVRLLTLNFCLKILGYLIINGRRYL